MYSIHIVKIGLIIDEIDETYNYVALMSPSIIFSVKICLFIDQEPARDEGPPPNEQEGDPQPPPEEHGMELDEYQQNYPERMPSGHMGGGGGGGGGGDSNGSDDDDVEGEDEDEAETDEGSENDADMVVLDPDHVSRCFG